MSNATKSNTDSTLLQKAENSRVASASESSQSASVICICWTIARIEYKLVEFIDSRCTLHVTRTTVPPFMRHFFFLRSKLQRTVARYFLLLRSELTRPESTFS